MSDVERARSATTTTINTAASTAAEQATNEQQQQQQQYKQQTATTTPGATVKLQHQQLYHNQLYHQNHQHQQYSKPTAVAQQRQQQQQPQQQQPQYQLITTAGGEFGNGENEASFFGGCFGLVLKVLFSPPGLVALVVVYSMLGACIFPLLEAPQDINTSAAIAKSREECLRELWIITEKLNVLYERNWSTLVHEQLRRFEDSIVAATRHTNNSSSVGMFGSSTTALRRYGSAFDTTADATLMPTHWSFGEALLYSVTVITTIGHGSLTPRTPAGKIATILYALIGVPLMLMCLSSLGALLAEALQCTYARICCRLATHQHHHHKHNRHHHHDDDNTEKKKHPPQDDHYQQQTHQLHVTGEKSGHLLEAAAGIVGGPSSGGGGGGAGKYARRCSADSLDDGVLLKRGRADCQQENGREFDCKNCKYDALVGEANPSNSYDYNGSGNIAGCGTDSGDDSCRLLQNSPAKLNQNQMLTGTKINAQYYQQQQQHHQPQLQQQQEQQKRPDVMLMAKPAMTVQKQMQQQYQQLYSRSATPSPQHFQQQPLQQLQQQTSTPPHGLQTFHIVSASSSPTHHHQQSQQHQQQQQQQLPQSTLRQYATLQPHQHKQQQQQYVAVPSGALVRFQTTTATLAATVAASALSGNSNNCTTDGNGNVGIGLGATLIATGMSGNCFQTANVPLPGSTATATIYFPIATAAHTQQQPTYASITGVSVAPPAPLPPTAANSDVMLPTKTMAGTSSAAAAATQLLCNQPIVKYHTIQRSQVRKQQQQQLLLKEPVTLLGSAADVMPLPPPPAYQTATVHGIRRAKFLTKPLPPEISTLVAGERDITCRHDLLLQQNDGSGGVSCGINGGNNSTNTATTATQSATTTPTTSTLNATNATSIAMLTAGLTATAPATATTSIAAATCSGNPPTTTAVTTQLGALMSGPASMVGSNATVDIMEDEEEHEQQRLGNCPHGTPSRVPLIAGGGNSTSSSGMGQNNSNSTTHTDDQRGARSLLNATAASFHRHTLNTFQRNAALRKSANFTAIRRAGCNVHTTSHHRSGKVSSCYGDTVTDETSDDGEDAAYMQRDATPSEQFRLTKLNSNCKHKRKHHSSCAHTADEHDYCDASGASTDDADGDEDAASMTDPDDAGPQVPISIVLLILICYICLGTVIFAFWENWSIVDGAYFCFVTLATIGYGDFIPERTFHGPHVQLFACCAYLLLGLVLVAMSFSILETQLMWKCKRIAVRLKLAND
ncbi:PREDICTED: uncharacterized protein LOC108367169 [Rhagoletis zephyria]|uniref:uncharacterized protein LOC108367169 n=1 Tax=Rhagoletis zephyria TaxID=28612 RepID=UPI000811A2DE|nr:PREDICTED: uncharacterized protein LOC108367169 [Rhagoletis zephyria]XP_017477349.1 PREDICTED: uncharacterized protein LOC108367169 [Rhagoletis zephyria]XP_017477413.1 PREDICTED: uncharacterized protein LOC108367169 [Rhagoletis zephyria]XP_017477481.1 PREDICTED: uncharacterized protein LOC108367169 [Rhagoletis zephyria]XP_017477548.1 PREDICTED: uncharacterized protein LOC108367169 [Rhagoletis zephyria]